MFASHLRCPSSYRVAVLGLPSFFFILVVTTVYGNKIDSIKNGNWECLSKYCSWAILFVELFLASFVAEHVEQNSLFVLFQLSCYCEPSYWTNSHFVFELIHPGIILIHSIHRDQLSSGHFRKHSRITDPLELTLNLEIRMTDFLIEHLNCVIHSSDD